MKKSGVLDEKPELKSLTNNQKKIVYLPIHHIGRKEYYKDISKKTDSLKRLDYAIFYEQVRTKLTNEVEYVTMAKKFRKISGDFNAGNGYLDTINKRIGNIKYNKKYNLINQPKLKELGIDTLTAVNADITLEKLIEEFENKNGKIELDECDEQTDLKSEYLCEALNSDLKKDFRTNFTLGLRNSNLANQIIQSESNKIFIIFGASHFKGLLEELQNIDPNWEEIK